jgi:hypothetical protein
MTLLPFVASIDLVDTSDESSDIKLVRSSVDKRVQHIRVRGSSARALAAMNEMGGR